MIIGHISNILRQLGAIYYADRIRYFYQSWENRKINREFIRKNPDIKLPPDYLLYESFQINYQKYYNDSIETAKWLTNQLSRHIVLKDKKILDWGCGPGRIIRHLPALTGNNCKFYGTDYNSKSIEWCITNLPDIQFINNTLKAELPYPDHFFDIIYGISVFTHLSEQSHYLWYNELNRIVKPGGILLFTSQGENFKQKLTASERRKYNNGELIVRGKTTEGHRTYSTFHPTHFMKSLFFDVEILEHIQSKSENRKSAPQDIWILRKIY